MAGALLYQARPNVPVIPLLDSTNNPLILHVTSSLHTHTTVALGDIDVAFALQAWHWAGSGGALGRVWRRGTFAWQGWHLRCFCVAGVALGDMDVAFARQA